MGDKERSEGGKIKDVTSLEDLQSRVGRAVCYSYDGGIRWQYGVIPIYYEWSVQEKKYVLVGPILEGYNPRTRIYDQGINVLPEKERVDVDIVGFKEQFFESDYSNPDFRIRTTTDEEIDGKFFSNGIIPLKENEPLVIPPLNEPQEIYDLGYGSITLLPPTGKSD